MTVVPIDFWRVKYETMKEILKVATLQVIILFSQIVVFYSSMKTFSFIHKVFSSSDLQD